MEQMKYSC